MGPCQSYSRRNHGAFKLLTSIVWTFGGLWDSVRSWSDQEYTSWNQTSCSPASPPLGGINVFAVRGCLDGGIYLCMENLAVSTFYQSQKESPPPTPFFCFCVDRCLAIHAVRGRIVSSSLVEKLDVPTHDIVYPQCLPAES